MNTKEKDLRIAQKKVTKLLQEEPVLHLATCNLSGRPGNCALEFVQRKGILYWRSGNDADHSKNLSLKNNCSVCVTRIFVDGSGEGIQSFGKAKVLSDQKEIKLIKKLLDGKVNKRRSKETILEEDNRQYWSFVSTKLYYMNERLFGYGRIKLK